MKGVGFGDTALNFHEKEFIVVGVWRKKADAIEIESKAINGLETDGAVNLGIVFGFEPLNELTVEDRKGIEVKIFGEKPISDRAIKAFDFSFSSSVSHGSVR